MPSRQFDLKRCPKCGNILGEMVAGLWLIRHHGREWLGETRQIKCEKCDVYWRPEDFEPKSCPA